MSDEDPQPEDPAERVEGDDVTEGEPGGLLVLGDPYAPDDARQSFDAEELGALLRNGVELLVVRSIVEGDLFLGGATVPEFGLIDCEVRGDIDGEHARFEGAVRVTGSVVTGETTFRSARFEADVILDDTTFQGAFGLPGADVVGGLFCDGARFECEVDLRAGTFGRRVQFERCRFENEASFESSDLGMAFFNAATFAERLLMTSCRARHVEMTDARVSDEAVFVLMEVDGQAIFNDSRFEADALFDLARFGSSGFSRARFGGLAQFPHFRSTSQFDGATFAQDATFRMARFETVSFDECRFGGDVSFQALAVERQAELTDMVVEGDALFEDARFGASATMAGSRLGGDLLMSLVRCDGALNLARIHVGGELDLSDVSVANGLGLQDARVAQGTDLGMSDFGGSVRAGGAEFSGDLGLSQSRVGKMLDLSSITCGGDLELVGTDVGKALLCSEARIDGKAVLARVHVGMDAVLTECEVGADLELSGCSVAGALSLSGTRVTGGVLLAFADLGPLVFLTDCSVRGALDLQGARIVGKLSLVGGDLRGRATLDRAEIATLELGTEPGEMPFRDGVSLHRTRLGWIEPVSAWKHLFSHLVDFDPWTYDHLEGVLRGAGSEALADDVYFARRLEEKKRIPSRSAALVDAFLHRATGYGVRLERILWISVPLVLGWAAVFWTVPGAVASTAVDRGAPISPRFVDALLLAIDTFVPVVSVPAAGAWEPAGLWRLAVLLLLFVPGWILVPVGIAGLAGALKR